MDPEKVQIWFKHELKISWSVFSTIVLTCSSRSKLFWFQAHAHSLHRHRSRSRWEKEKVTLIFSPYPLSKGHLRWQTAKNFYYEALTLNLLMHVCIFSLVIWKLSLILSSLQKQLWFALPSREKRALAHPQGPTLLARRRQTGNVEIPF